MKLSGPTCGFVLGGCGGVGSLLVGYGIGSPFVAVGMALIVICVLGAAWLDVLDKEQSK